MTPDTAPCALCGISISRYSHASHQRAPHTEQCPVPGCTATCLRPDRGGRQHRNDLYRHLRECHQADPADYGYVPAHRASGSASRASRRAMPDRKTLAILRLEVAAIGTAFEMFRRSTDGR